MTGIPLQTNKTVEYRLNNSSRYLRFATMIMVIVGFAFIGGIASSRYGIMAVPAAGGLLVCMIILIIGYQFWWKLLLFLLFGYMVASRGFAGLGFYPIYIGEIVMALGIVSIMLIPFSGRLKFVGGRTFLRWPFLVLSIFLLWQIIQTVPYVKAYQFDALRDAMLYGYALFAIIIMVLIPRPVIERFFQFYGQIVPLILMWMPMLFFVSRLRLFPLIYTKGSDVGVHLAGIGAYMLLQLDQHKHPWPRIVTWMSWLFWSISTLLFGMMGRDVLLTAAASMGVVFLLRPIRSRWDRPLLLVIIVISLMLITDTYSTLRIDLGTGRDISAEQLAANIVSIFDEGDNSEGSLEGTKQWRLNWWNTIIDYTVHGAYFWKGKGYGINLANSDGFQVESDASLRSPHNGHMTLLARSGVPGFVLWIMFLASMGIMLLRHALFNRNADSWRANYAVWLLSYLVAFIIMACFDVFLEGPMGGIWFWVLIGMIFVFFSEENKNTGKINNSA